ncbi:uncharacterized protein LOC129350063 [Amphiprion ocellaris]|uniref:uncharacterized protein LOC129349988 n=1 Tax=Amphiprion ocellaris TaxID=80972 RepID=UPI00241144A7|nr:uncharacterized protein LOC129349988 [Amphiprion ocellaris]XP_054871444.1 uncharacterized protein LOC129350063 [Amphiprion ocellaris]
MEQPMKRKLTDDTLNPRSSPDATSPPTKMRRVCEEKPSRKRCYSEAFTDISSDSPPTKMRRVCEEKPSHEQCYSEAFTDISSDLSPPKKMRISDTALLRITSDFSSTKRLVEVVETPPKVWIIGSSYIRRAEDAAHEEFGPNLGLNATVHWFGKGGLRWNGVIPRFYAELAQQTPPDVLVVHAGGNDLGLVSPAEHAANIEADLVHLHKAFPSMAIVFSAINERKAWRYGKPVKINADRKMVNRYLKKAAGSFGGRVVEHHSLRHFEKVFLPDGVHFNKRGNRIFLTKIRNDVREILQQAI